jgi:hypothetical protein
MKSYPEYNNIIKKLTIGLNINEKDNFQLRLRDDLNKFLNNIEYINDIYKIERRPYTFHSSIVNTLNRFDILIYIDSEIIINNDDYYNLIKQAFIEEGKILNENNYSTSHIFNKKNKFIGLNIHFCF